MPATTTPAGTKRRNDFADSPARVATAFVALFGLLLMLAGVGAAACSEKGWAWGLYTPLIILGVGVLAVGFFVVFNFEWLGDVISGRAAVSGLLVAVMCVAALVVWGAGNYFFSYKGQIVLPRSKKTVPLTKSWDLTKVRKFTLDGKTTQQLKELTEPLNLLVKGRLYIYQPGSNRPSMQAEELLDMYAAASPLVTVTRLGDDEKSGAMLRAAAEKLHREPDDLANGTLILVYKDRARALAWHELCETRPYMPMGNQVMQAQIFKGEEVITSTICQLLDVRKPKIYFVVGHGERDPDGRDERGLSLAQDRLKGDNMETARLELPTAEKVPDDADLVVICGPRLAFGAKELEVLKQYVDDRKGRLLICLDAYRPQSELGLDGFLADFGVAIGRDRILDMARRYPDDPAVTVAMEFGNNPAVDKLREGGLPVLFGPARSVRRLDEYRGDWNVDVLVSGSEGSFGETDLNMLYSRGQAAYQEGVDTPRPASYAVASWAGQAPMPGGRMEKNLGRVAVVGDATWCSNDLIRRYGNESLFSAAVKWLIGQETRIAIEPKKANEQPIELRPAQGYIAMFAGATVLVLLMMVAGLTAWIRRR